MREFNPYGLFTIIYDLILCEYIILSFNKQEWKNNIYIYATT